MVMGWIWTGLIALSILSAALTGRGNALAGAAMKGAQSGVTLTVSMAGAMCLWSGVGKLLEKTGAMELLSKLLSPILGRIFPDSREDGLLRGYLCGNICANLLGLGNAATPMGIQAAKRLKTPGSDAASDQLCRLVVLNTASIQLLPTNVAAVRAALGCGRPFDVRKNKLAAYMTVGISFLIFFPHILRYLIEFSIRIVRRILINQPCICSE